MKKKWFGWSLALLACSALAVALVRWRKGHAAPDVVWKSVPVFAQRIAAKVTASGTLQATVTVQVGAQVSGRIQKLGADYNTTVQKGQLLAKLDPQLFQASVEQAQANFMAAKAGVAKADAQEKDAARMLERTAGLAAAQLASAAELQASTTALAVAKASTDEAKASLAQTAAALHQAQVSLGYTAIFSPINGTVIARSVDVGQTVAASLQAPVLFTIAEDLSKMQVHTSVAEGDVGRLAEAMAASFTVDAFPRRIFKGRLAQIRNAPQTVQNVVTYDAVIDVENPDLTLRPGMTATVTIAYAERVDALAIPNAALRFRPPPESVLTPAVSTSSAAAAGSPALPNPASSGRRARVAAAGGRSGDESESVVYVMRGVSPEAVTVTTGLSDGTMTEVLKGLTPGDQVVTEAAVSGSAAKPQAAPAGAGGASGAPRLGRMF